MGGGGSKRFVVRNDVIGQDLEALRTFQLLELTDEDINALFAVFTKLDTGRVNLITISSLLSYISVLKSKLSTRILRSADVDHDGRLSFREFVLNAWIFATMDFEGICGYAFDNFDIDGSGELKLSEVHDMVADVHYRDGLSAEEIDKTVGDILRAMDDGNRDKVITKAEFFAHCLEFKELLYPALQIQVNINQNIVGTAFWERKMQDAPRYSIN